jgi:hypothetical protein
MSPRGDIIKEFQQPFIAKVSLRVLLATHLSRGQFRASSEAPNLVRRIPPLSRHTAQIMKIVAHQVFSAAL